MEERKTVLYVIPVRLARDGRLRRRFEVYIAVPQIRDKHKCALQMGEATQDIFDALRDTSDDYVMIITKLDDLHAKRILTMRCSSSATLLSW